MYVCIHTYIHIYIDIDIDIYIDIYICRYICIGTYICICAGIDFGPVVPQLC